jgi:thioredoxin reductase (NADPH)
MTLDVPLFLGPKIDGSEGRAEGIYDVIIIGGGPAGAAAAIYTARAELETVVLDKGVTAGALGMTGKIVNYPGVPEQLRGAELISRIRGQAEGFGAHFVQDRVLATRLHGETKQVSGGQGVYLGRAVIVASGSMGRTGAVSGEERLVGWGVSYCVVCDGAFFRNTQVAVAGNNDEAVEEALSLTKFASRVHLLVQTPSLRASADLADQAGRHPNVELHLSTRLQEVIGEQRVEGVRVLKRGGDADVLPVSGVFIYLQGGRPITEFLDGQLETTETGCVKVDDTMQTSIPGIFAAGDVLCNHLKQAVIAAAEGARAAVAVERYLSGREKLSPDWS